MGTISAYMQCNIIRHKLSLALSLAASTLAGSPYRLCISTFSRDFIAAWISGIMIACLLA